MWKMIDLCAGIGGIRRGYELAGDFKCVLSAEIDKYACMTYEHLYGDNPKNDITDETFKEQVHNTEYDILLAGFPCQSFSRAGKELGFLDKTRGTLFFDIADIIRRTQPKAFMLENVDNLISHDKGSTFNTIINVLVNDLDYKVVGVRQEPDENGNMRPVFDPRSFIRNSRNFGVPQNRPRVYIMGFSRKHFGDAVDSLPDQLPEKRKQPIYSNLNDVLETNADAAFYLSSGYVETLKKHRERHKNRGNGFGYMIVNSPEIENPCSNALLATGGSGKERNLVYDPQESVAGMIVPGKKTPLNDAGIRMMTPREWGKLQGFVGYGFMENGEDRFSLPDGISNAQAYKQFGNAVTIPAVEEMAKFMKKCLKNLEKDQKNKKGDAGNTDRNRNR
ncbi:DNA (cytosine-5-)-methyltransferase [Methanosarcinaceae archaeon]|nr:DNA (cytosine-5-)-methyltransferase [Methanosarcinaceae archaeon]